MYLYSLKCQYRYISKQKIQLDRQVHPEKGGCLQPSENAIRTNTKHRYMAVFQGRSQTAGISDLVDRSGLIILLFLSFRLALLCDT